MVFVFSSSSSEGPTYLPPFKCFIREGAVLPAHQRADGLVEALREPGVVLHLRHAPSTGARTPGEEVVRQSECNLEEVNRGVPQVVADQDGGEGGDAEEQHKHPDFPSLPQSHVVPDQWAGKGGGFFHKRIGEVSLQILLNQFHQLPSVLTQEVTNGCHQSLMINLESKQDLGNM